MGHPRLILSVLILTAVGVGLVHPGLRRKLKEGWDECRWKISGRHPNDLYLQAERLYNAGDFRKATWTCGEALKLNPGHACAKALLVELQFILGQDKLAKAHQAELLLWQHQAALIAIDRCLERADRDIEQDEFDQAALECRKVLQYTTWMPVGIEVEMRVEPARRRLSSLEN